MISPAFLYRSLRDRGINFFTGVPDSLLKNFCAYVGDECDNKTHIIAANEGNALALAAGFHLSTGGISVVYLQNSGLGNLVNPLLSLTTKAVYKIPALLVIGWRGEPGVKDEPQHVQQGEVTEQQLQLMNVPYFIMDSDSDVDGLLSEALGLLEKTNEPVALLIRKNTFSAYKSQQTSAFNATMLREDALRGVLDSSEKDDLFIATTGKTSRELFELRAARNEVSSDFLTVGSMGHTSSIALGVALGQPNKRVFCLDGDGSLLMHLGALPIIASVAPDNLVHVLLNNSAHESVGGQPTVASQINFEGLSSSVGYKKYYLAEDLSSLKASLESIKKDKGPTFLEVRILKGSRDDLGRPTSTALENKLAFMENVNE